MWRIYWELWRKEPMIRRILGVSLLADIAFGALLPLIPFYLRTELKASPTLIGGVLAAYVITETFLKAPFGALSDRYGRKAILLIGLFGSTFAVMTMGFIRPGYVKLFFALYPIVGCAVAALWPSIATLITDYAPQSERGGMLGIINLSYLIGLAIGPTVGFVLHHFHGTYRFAFFMTAVLLGAASLIAAFTLPGRRPLSPRGPRGITMKRGQRLSALSRPVFLLAGLFACIQFAIAGLIPVAADFVKGHLKLSDLTLAVMVIFGAVTLAVLSVPMGRVSDHLGRENAIRLALVTGTLTLVVAPYIRQPWQLEGLGLLAGSVWLIAVPAILALSSEIVTEGEKGFAVGLVTGAQGVGFAFGSIAGGRIAERLSLYAPFYLGSFALLLAFLLSGWLTRELRTQTLGETEA